ncbi:MAG: hypothetical protein QXX77_05265 [Candidatus Methanosuratincola sp.]
MTWKGLAVDAKELEKSKLYSEELGIDLASGDDRELFKWFLASVLFGARISETIAKNTYRAFEKYGLLEPQKILEAGWSFLVYSVMSEGGYVRYDEKTSRKILTLCEALLKDYGGSLRRLHDEASSSRDLEKRLTGLYGIGPTTVNIFLRELRPFWEKSDPEPMPIVKELARRFNIDLNGYDRKSITFARVEAGLIRLRRELKRSFRQ